MLQEPAEPLAPAEPKQSGSFRYLQGMLEAGEGGKTPAPSPIWFPPIWFPDRPLAAPSLARPWPPPPPSSPNPIPNLCAGVPQKQDSRAQPHTHRSEVFPFLFFFNLRPSAPGFCHLRWGFQESGRDLAAPGT